MKSRVRKMSGYILAGSLIFSSCMDQRYDWNNGVDLSVNVGGKNLTIPLGKTDSIFLKSFLDSTEMLKIIDGVYSLEMHGKESIAIPSIAGEGIKTPALTTLINHSFDFFKISSIAIPDIVPVSQTIDLGIEFNGVSVQVPSIEYVINAPLSFTLPDFSAIPEGSINEKYPISGVKYEINENTIEINLLPITLPNVVKKVNFVKLTSGSKISLQFSKKNFDRFLGTSKMNSLKIVLPKLLVPSSNSSITQENGLNVYTLTAKEIENGTVIDIPLDRLDLSGYAKNQSGQITISNCGIKYKGEVELSGDVILKPNGTYVPFTNFPKVEIAMSTTMSVASIEVETGEMSSGPIDQSIEFAINQQISTSISKIESIVFETGCVLAVDFSVNGLSESMLNALKTKGLEIQFPQQLKFAENQGVTAQNKYIITSLPLKKDFVLTGLNVNQTLTNGSLNMNLGVKASGEFVVDSMTINTVDLQGIDQANFKITTSVKGMKIADAKVTSDRIEFSKEITDSFGEIKINVPAELKQAYGIWTRGGNLKIDLKIKNYPESFPKVILDQLMLTLPDFLYVNGQTGDKHNKLVYTNIEIEKTGKLFEIQLDSICFATPIVNEKGLMLLAGDIEYTFKAHIPSASISIQD